jgi:hypothetical protein
LQVDNNNEYDEICSEYEIIITGIPCGSDQYISAFIDRFLEELQQEVNKFKAIDKSHAKWVVLKPYYTKCHILLKSHITQN